MGHKKGHLFVQETEITEFKVLQTPDHIPLKENGPEVLAVLHSNQQQTFLALVNYYYTALISCLSTLLNCEWL